MDSLAVRTEPAPLEGAKTKLPRKTSAVLLLFLLICAAGIMAGGWLLYNGLRTKAVKEAERNLAIIADLKVRQIAAWRRERLGDAEVISRHPLNRVRIQPFLEKASLTDQGRDIKAWMESLRAAYAYSNVVLVDPHPNH